MAYLISTDSSVLNPRTKIENSPITIGRNPDCDVVMEGNSVSRRHATISHDQGQYYIQDLNSRNGTLVNGSEIHGKARLFDGSEIRICDVGFVFQLEDTPVFPRQRTTVHDRSSDYSQNRSSFIVVDDNEKTGSTIMSQVDVPSHHEQRHSAGDLEKKLKAIATVTRSLSSTVDRNEILSHVLDNLFELFVEADRGFIAMLGPDQTVVPHSMKTRRPQNDEQVSISRTIVKLVMDTRQAVLSTDAASDKRFDLSKSIVDFRIRSMMCAPLLDTEGKSIGVVQLDALRPSIAFTPNDLEVLVTVAVQASLALQRVELFRKTELSRQLEQDLKLAQEVQLRFLPQAQPKIEDYRFYSYYRPTAQVGGDYFDYIQLSETQVVVLVADVVGHGVAAALLMAKISAEARFAVALNLDPVHAVEKINKGLAGLNLDKFVTLLLCHLDCKTHQVTFVNAGHMPPILRTAKNRVSFVGGEEYGLPLGIDSEATYSAGTFKLGKGDVLLLYTDGVNECMNSNGEQLGLDALLKELEQSQAKSPELMGKAVCQAIHRHVGGHPQFDDICIVCIGR